MLLSSHWSKVVRCCLDILNYVYNVNAYDIMVRKLFGVEYRGFIFVNKKQTLLNVCLYLLSCESDIYLRIFLSLNCMRNFAGLVSYKSLVGYISIYFYWSTGSSGWATLLSCNNIIMMVWYHFCHIPLWSIDIIDGRPCCLSLYRNIRNVPGISFLKMSKLLSSVV